MTTGHNAQPSAEALLGVLSEEERADLERRYAADQERQNRRRAHLGLTLSTLRRLSVPVSSRVTCEIAATGVKGQGACQMHAAVSVHKVALCSEHCTDYLLAAVEVGQ